MDTRFKVRKVSRRLLKLSVYNGGERKIKLGQIRRRGIKIVHL